MTKRQWRDRPIAMGALMAFGLTLCGGCVAIDSADTETFLRDLLLSAAAAWFL